jgi:hypothetical protein
MKVQLKTTQKLGGFFVFALVINHTLAALKLQFNELVAFEAAN